MDDLRALIARHAGQTSLPIDGMVLSLVPEPTGPQASVAEPIFVIVAQGAKRLTLGDQFYEYGSGQYLVVSVDLPVTGHFAEASPDRPFLGFGLRLRPTDIAALLLETSADDRWADDRWADERRANDRWADDRRADDRRADDRWADDRWADDRFDEAPPAARSAPLGIAVSTADDDLIDAVVRLLRLIDRPADLPVLAPMVEKEILWRLITGAQGAIVRQIGLADSSLSQIGRSIRWIRDHYADALRVEELARLASMSVSSFHRHFRAVTAMTPIQFQKRIRLQEARLRLVGQAEAAAEVGFAVGYDSVSQFTREYRRQFGLPPGQDAVRLRQSTRGGVLASPSI